MRPKLDDDIQSVYRKCWEKLGLVPNVPHTARLDDCEIFDLADAVAFLNL